MSRVNKLVRFRGTFFPIISRRNAIEYVKPFCDCRCLATWTPFTLSDQLTLDVKKSIETKWGSKVYGEACPAELNNERKSRLSSGKNYYVLSMFPYPSGRLHLGHVRVYTLSDVLARFNRLRGHKVIHPMGWDAFGLPAENAARDHGIEPSTWTYDNIQYMRDQMIRMGCCFDWKSEIATCDPNYYKWTQWLFIKLWENGLAYKKQSYVYWDPVDQTVLAEEQVDSEMRSWRSGAKVEKKLLRQWFIKTTVFAKDLYDCLDTDVLKIGWREIIAMQKHWIGPIQGYFSECVPESQELKNPDNLRLWFSDSEKLKAARFLILRPDHYMVANTDENIIHVHENGVKQAKFFVKNPYNGDRLPVFTSSSIDMPLVPESSDCRLDELLSEEIFGDLAINEHHMDSINNIFSTSMRSTSGDGDKVNNEFQYYPSSLRLRDWLVSRQRRWGTPIPAMNCSNCGHTAMVHESELPVTSHSPSSNTKCTHCGSASMTRETDTLDTFFDSSWYYLRFFDSENSSNIFDPKSVEPFLPVSVYIGGSEHATLHLYYARFMAHFLHRLGLIKVKETFRRLIPIGVVKGETYVLNKSGKFISKECVEEVDKKKLAQKETGLFVTKKWEKMSKSKCNGVEPELMIDQYGIDTSRLLSMAEAVPTSPRKWSTENFNGFLKFQQKVWHQVQDFVEAKDKEDHEIPISDVSEWQKLEDELFDARNYYLKGVTYNYGKSNQISVVISKLQGLIGAVRKIKNINYKDSIQHERCLGTLIIAMYPIMPSFSAQLWQYFREVANLTESEFDLENEVWCQKWPEVDHNYNLDLIVEVNSVEACAIKVERHVLDTLDLNVAMELALEQPDIAAKFSDGIAEKVISFVVQPSYRAVMNLRDISQVSKPKINAKAKQ